MVIICCSLLTYHILTSSPLPVLHDPSIDYFQHRVFTSTYSLINKVSKSTFSLFSPTMSPSYVPPHLRKSATAPQTPIKTVRWRDHVQDVSPTNQHEPAPEQVSNKVSAFVTPSAKYNKDRQNPDLNQVYTVLFHQPATLMPRQYYPYAFPTQTTIISTHLSMGQANKAAKEYWEQWPKSQLQPGGKPTTWQYGQAGRNSGKQNVHNAQLPFEAQGWLYTEWKWYGIEVVETKISVE